MWLEIAIIFGGISYIALLCKVLDYFLDRKNGGTHG